ncbi:hypothetical protein Plhal304r1_c071g0159561 [Plasmopara halstedii]
MVKYKIHDELLTYKSSWSTTCLTSFNFLLPAPTMTLLVLRARHLRSNSDKISTRGCEQECIVTSRTSV